MQVTETKSEGLRREFKVVVPAADIERRLESRLEELSHQVSLPGFRPGKVPLSLLRQRYGASVMGEVLERAVSESSNVAISERSLQPVGQPQIEVTSFDEGRDLEYTLAIELLPKFEPMDFADLKLEKLKAEVTDEKVDDALKNLAARHQRFGETGVERPAALGDQIVIDFEGKLDGVAFEGGTAKDWRTVLGKSGFVPGFEENLIGRKAGEEVTFDLHFPDDYGNQEMAGKDTVFTVKIKEIREPIEVQVDDQLAKDMGLEDLATLRNSVRDQLEREYGAISRARLKRALLDQLAAAHDFEVPEGLVENEFQAIWNQYHAEEGHDHAHDHDHDHDHEHGEAKPADDAETEQERAECREVAERRVRLGLLLGEVGRRNNIMVTPEELSRAVFAEASRYPGQEKQVVDFIRKSPQALGAIRAPLFEDKVVDFILEIAKVAERTVNAEELLKDPDEPISSEAEPKPKGRKKASKG